MLVSLSNLSYNKFSNNKVSFKMNESFFIKSRNGHLLLDTFDKASNSLDIRSNGLYPSNVLSNLSKKPFVFDGVECLSIEGFLQSLKVNNPEKQQQICKLHGGSAKNISKKYNDWHKTGILYWQGIEYKRNSDEYKELLSRAYKKCYDENLIFQQALSETKGMTLIHSQGKNDINQTVLTSDEFIDILNKLRFNEL